jgi:tetratricopeptide (TPR) repeat protein
MYLVNVISLRILVVPALFLPLLGLESHSVLAQDNLRRDQRIEVAQLNARLEAVESREKRIDDLVNTKTVEVAELKAKLDTTNSMLNIAVGFLAVVLTGSLVGFIRSEKRATEAHAFSLTHATTSEQRATEAFKLAVTGETAALSRAAEVHEKFLSGSRETLDLVNATLTLANEASERAAKTIEARARLTIKGLDRDCQSLLASVPAQDDRALISQPANRSKLRSLAQKIAGFEINRFILPEDIHLTSPCHFIRGMDFHLNQQFEDAIENWRTVALSPDTSDSLKSLAWYWIGYEQNNLNQFDEAQQSFENALGSATGGRKYELQRILIETRFFNKSKNAAKDLIQPLQNLREEISKEPRSEDLDARRIKISITLGNVISQTGRELAANSQKVEALELFSKAKELYREAPRDKWAQFGLAEMMNESSTPEEQEEAQGIFRAVRAEAIEESVRREEPRTKVLARTTELVCCLRVPEFNVEAPAIRSLVLQALGSVDERLTVYSQIQRRNVTKSEFQDDLDAFINR